MVALPQRALQATVHVSRHRSIYQNESRHAMPGRAPRTRSRARAANRRYRRGRAGPVRRAGRGGRRSRAAGDRLEADPVRGRAPRGDGAVRASATTASKPGGSSHPHVIVEHYTASTTFSSAWNTFASDAPDRRTARAARARARTSSIDRDGTVYQLVPLTTICRHTVGLNWTAIGIEHVGTSDASILDNPRQLRASLRLTLWLMHRYGISLPNVIGHAESLTSRLPPRAVRPVALPDARRLAARGHGRPIARACSRSHERARRGLAGRRAGGLSLLKAFKRSAFPADETRSDADFLRRRAVCPRARGARPTPPQARPPHLPPRSRPRTPRPRRCSRR